MYPSPALFPRPQTTVIESTPGQRSCNVVQAARPARFINTMPGIAYRSIASWSSARDCAAVNTRSNAPTNRSSDTWFTPREDGRKNDAASTRHYSARSASYRRDIADLFGTLPVNLDTLAKDIKSWGRDLGFQQVAITDLDVNAYRNVSSSGSRKAATAR